MTFKPPKLVASSKFSNAFCNLAFNWLHCHPHPHSVGEDLGAFGQVRVLQGLRFPFREPLGALTPGWRAPGKVAGTPVGPEKLG